MKKVEILYEDEEIIVINKSPNTLSIPDRFKPEKFNLKSYLENRFDTIYVVHRLDKDTSGLICFAKTEEAHRSLSLQFQNRNVTKIYHLFCDGHPPESDGIIDEPILKRSDGKSIIHKTGKPSQTAYKVLQKFQAHSILEFELLTGRTHQARIHASHIGCPLIVDPVYGNRDRFFLSTIKRNYRSGKNNEEQPLLSRTPLHAKILTLSHPTTKKRIHFEADYPKDLKALKNQLTKWSSIK